MKIGSKLPVFFKLNKHNLLIAHNKIVRSEYEGLNIWRKQILTHYYLYHQIAQLKIHGLDESCPKPDF